MEFSRQVVSDATKPHRFMEAFAVTWLGHSLLQAIGWGRGSDGGWTIASMIYHSSI